MRSLINRKKNLISLFFILPIFLTGCSIGPIKLVEKIPKQENEIKKDYGKLKEQKAPKEKEVEIKNEEIEYNENEEIVSVVDGIQFKKAKFTVSPAIEGVEYRTKPKDGDKKRVAMKTYLSVVGVSVNNDIYMIKVEGNYYFIDIDKTQKEEQYDKDQEKKRIEEEKKREEELKKQEEAKKKEEEIKKKEEQEKKEKEKNEIEKRKREEENKKKQQTNVRKNNSSNQKSNNNQGNNKNTQGNSSNYNNQPSYSQPSYSYSPSPTYNQQQNTQSSTPESNILYPRNSSNVESISGINFAIERFTAKVINEAEMNSEPSEAIAGSNSFTYGTLPSGTTVDVLGIGENGWIKVSGPGGRIVFVHGSHLER